MQRTQFKSWLQSLTCNLIILSSTAEISSIFLKMYPQAFCQLLRAAKKRLSRASLSAVWVRVSSCCMILSQVLWTRVIILCSSSSRFSFNFTSASNAHKVFITSGLAPDAQFNLKIKIRLQPMILDRKRTL